MNALTIEDLVVGLERYSDLYAAIDVYAADVVELQRARDLGAVVPLEWNSVAPNQYAIPTSRGQYVAEFKPELGVLRLRREATAATEPVVAALAGAGIAALFSKKPEAVIAGAILGMLVAHTLAPGGARQVLTMKFNPTERQWRAYSGALIPTMKQSLGVTPA